MAKKKNAVKSALNSLRQALTVIKTAIIRFSAEHVLAISYNPTTKETTVTDVPQNLSSQFILGEGGGSAELHPKLTLKVSPHNSDANVLNGVICLSESIAVLEDGCLVVLDDIGEYKTTITDENTGTGTVILSAIREDGQTYLDIAVNMVVFSTDEAKLIDTVTASNPVNCSFDNGFVTITDITKDASIDLDVVFDGGAD